MVGILVRRPQTLLSVQRGYANQFRDSNRFKYDLGTVSRCKPLVEEVGVLPQRVAIDARPTDPLSWNAGWLIALIAKSKRSLPAWERSLLPAGRSPSQLNGGDGFVALRPCRV
tara:strand:+ start:54 stop:392 length:339 start_codon:yes stop_codon:yes gene_type:complete